MTHRPHPKYASNDARRGPWAMCSDCQFNWSLSDLQFQYDFRGGSTPMNTGWLRCPRCISPLTYQRKLLIIPPDPPPIFNTRPEPYFVDEAGPTQDLAVVIILNSNINASLLVSPAPAGEMLSQTGVIMVSQSGAVMITEA